MKSLNIIVISEETPANALESVAQGNDIESQVNAMNALIVDNPELANDPDVKALFELSEKIKSEEIANGVNQDKGQQQQQQQQPNENDEGGNGSGENKDGGKPNQAKEKSPLSSLPFFSDDEGATVDELASLTVETLPEFAKKLGVDITKPGWIGEVVSKAVKPQGTEFESKYNELVESINLLPKELQTAVSSHMEGKDWRTVLTNASSIDLSKDFESLSADEKIKVHNYYFPEDSIQAGEDISKKELKKSIVAAESKYTADKVVYNSKIEKSQRDIQQKQAAFLSSADTSLSQLKKDYPQFKEKEIKTVEEIIKKQGIASLFMDKNGNLLPDAAEKITFALRGKDILAVATSLAENKGKSSGKAEVLAVDQNQNNQNPNSGGTQLTDAEKSVRKIVGDSMISQNLTY